MSNKFLNLVDGSKADPKRPGPERRRLPRLNLTGEQFKLAINGKVYPVSDLSEDGMALRMIQSEELRIFPVAARLAGTLNLQGEKYPVHVRVRHVAPSLVGCEFEDLKPETKEVLRRFLDPATLGRELKPVPDPENASLWYRGPSGTNLLLWRGADGQYHRLALFFLGNYIQWDAEQGVVTGRAQPAEDRDLVHGIVHFETTIMERDAAVDPGKLDIAKTLLLSSNLPQDLKKWCARQLS